LRTEGLRGAGRYWDCRTDDARLVLETILAAVQEGAVAVSYGRVTALLKEAGRIVGARLVDRLGGGELTVRARVVVNATGPWVDSVANLDAPTAPRLRPTKGVHVLVPRARVGNRAAVVLHAVQDGRVMFVIPWGGQALVGTTDTDHEGAPDVPAGGGGGRRARDRRAPPGRRGAALRPLPDGEGPAAGRGGAAGCRGGAGALARRPRPCARDDRSPRRPLRQPPRRGAASRRRRPRARHPDRPDAPRPAGRGAGGRRARGGADHRGRPSPPDADRVARRHRGGRGGRAGRGVD